MAMTASMTRSRRAEGPRLTTHSPIRPKIVTISPNANLNLNGTKRKYDQSSHELDQVVTKKPRFTTSIAVEIPAARLDARPKPAPAKSTGPIPIPHHPPNPSRAATSTTATAVKDTPTTNAKLSRTKHQEKVANGLKHELNRLQPSLPPDADLKSQGRKLRSQEQSRFKSELSTYFPEYDEVIGNEPKERYLINVDTPIAIVPGVGAGPESRPSLDESSDSQQHTSDQSYSVRGYGDSLFTDLFDSQTVDFSFLASGNQKRKSQKDPLPDSIFEPWHKKEERAERSARNTEKGRAQHEKEQIIRLLEGLQGHDWLRVMGVSGITESKKKTFEPARDHFIKGCEAILEKFRRWAAEEKRRKREKDRAHAEAEARRKAAERQTEEDDAEEEEEEDEEEGPIDEEDEEEEVADSDEEIDDDEQDDKDDESDGDPPDYDVDASIAKQLREEAIAAAKKRSRGRRARDSPRPLPQPEPEFKSFFKKPHERAQALNKGRRRGRTAKAWGEPVPEVKETEFRLPEELSVHNKEFMTWWGREKRTRKRRKV